MDGYKKNSYAVYDIKYHVIWVTKYRYKVLDGPIAIRTRELIRQGCEASILFAVVLAVAVIKVKLTGGFLGNGQMAGYELDMALMAISIYLAITNKSLFAIDNVIFQTKNA